MVKLSRGEHRIRGAPVVRYEIKIAVGRSQWTWIVHTPPKPLEGSIGGQARRNSRGREGDRSMVGEAPAHNEATGRDLYASLIGWPPVGPPLSARGEAETRAVGAGRAVGRDGARSTRPHPVAAGGRTSQESSMSFDKRRSIQAVAPLASCVSQQAFKHITGIRVGGVMARSRDTN